MSREISFSSALVIHVFQTQAEVHGNIQSFYDPEL